MRRAIIAMALATLTQSTSVRADGSPPWVSRAKRIVAHIRVPARGGNEPREGTGFFVGFKGQTAYLVTAGHVIWPNELPKSEENVKLDIRLPGCDVSVPAVANSAQVSPLDKLDAALVKINLTDIPNDAGGRCQDVIAHLPRHIIDPDGGSLSENASAWLIGPGVVFEGRDARPITFKKLDGNALVFSEPFTSGDSGSPVFSKRGHIIGMVIIGDGLATRFSLILTMLDKDWEVPTNLAGPCSKLSFSDRYRGAPLSIDGAPDVALEQLHPAPLGPVVLKLRISDTQQVTDTVDIEGASMNCDVTISRWLARHRRAGVYTTLGLVAATGIAFAVATTSRNSFDQSPSRSSYDHVGLFNAITIGTGSASLASLGATVVGYFSSDTTGITCREGPR